jgi:hypothetical protein
MLVLLGTLSIFISGASTLCGEDSLTHRSSIAADMDAAMMIDEVPTSKNHQTKKTEGKNSASIQQEGRK